MSEYDNIPAEQLLDDFRQCGYGQKKLPRDYWYYILEHYRDAQRILGETHDDDTAKYEKQYREATLAKRVYGWRENGKALIQLSQQKAKINRPKWLRSGICRKNNKPGFSRRELTKKENMDYQENWVKYSCTKRLEKLKSN